MPQIRTRNPNLDRHLLFRLPDVLAYLFSPSLWMTLLGLAIISSILQAMAFGIFGSIALLMAIGLEVGVFFHITRSSANGDRTFSAPDFENFFDSLVMPILLVLVAALPMILALYFATNSLFSVTLAFGNVPMGPLALLIIGVLLFPLLLTVGAINGTIGGVLNPALWANALGGFRTSYIVALAGFYGIWYVEMTLFRTLALQIQDTPIFGVSVLATMVLYIPAVLRYRLLGALCEPFMAIDYAPEIPEAIVVRGGGQYAATFSDNLLQLQGGTMSPVAILRMANTAYSEEQYRLVYRATEALWKTHKNSSEVIEALWLSAKAQEQQKQLDAMRATLRQIISHNDAHPIAGDARLKLRQYE
ncbi:MAG: hypothetical protein JKY56_09750 [Kofleriaceae bacterium]|nr:hypothetical protein [Kofleriaceae bacterium]